MPLNLKNFNKDFEETFGDSWKNIASGMDPANGTPQQMSNRVSNRDWAVAARGSATPTYFHASKWTCGVCELGGLSTTINVNSICVYAIPAITFAVMNKRGLMVYFLPKDYNRALTDKLEYWGFKQSREFVNPNTGNTLHQYSLILDGVKKEVVG